ncbi:ThiF family adenylyltransferase [Cellulomonas sp. NS3]|uniref:ThiF family adenylyltransferase n=1 Tax=Cellulomonas sp. NS3 TaxID=2973977 RepID=UPI002162A65C|nr:ThiF family adenylyltransferase [Cellulomonas sp. NS3]
MRLRPHLRVLRRGPDELQVGTDPRWAVRLTGLAPGEAELLQELETLPELDRWLPWALGQGLDRARAEHLVGLLVDAQVTSAGGRRSPTVRAGAGADVSAWTLLRPDGDGAAQVDARRSAVVGVCGLGRLGLAVATTLAVAGVGTVLLDDDGVVRSSDIGPGGYRMGDVGSARLATAARVLRDVAPEVRCDAAPGTAPDLVVLVEHGAASPETALRLVTAGLAHLSVVVREGDALVGPLVVPVGAGGRRAGDAVAGGGPSAAPARPLGRGSACLRCLDLHRGDVDPAWPLVVAQLVCRPPTSSGPAGEPVALAGLGSALAAAEALTYLDGGVPRTRGATYELAMPDLLPALRAWAVHPDCGCTALPRTPVPALARPGR